MTVSSIIAFTMRWQVLATLAFGLAVTQSSLAIVPTSSSVVSSSSSAPKAPAPAKVVTSVAVKAVAVKPVVIAVKPQHVSARAATHTPVLHASLKSPGGTARGPTTVVAPTSSATAVLVKPAI